MVNKPIITKRVNMHCPTTYLTDASQWQVLTCIWWWWWLWCSSCL